MKRLLLACVLAAAAIAVAAVSTHQRTSALRATAAARALLDDGILRTVILGDSVAHGAGDERGRGIAGALDENLRALGIRAAVVANLGINGARTRDVRRLLARAPARANIRNADVIVLSIGGNDLYGDSPARLLAALVPDRRQERTVARVQRVIQSLRDVNPAARIYLLGLYNPYRHRWLDRQVDRWDARLIARFAGHPQVTVVRICDLLRRDDRISALDRFHPGAAGYAAIASRIAASM